MCSCIRNTKSDWLQRRQLTFVHKTFHRGVLNASVGFRTPLVLARIFSMPLRHLSNVIIFFLGLRSQMNTPFCYTSNFSIHDSTIQLCLNIRYENIKFTEAQFVKNSSCEKRNILLLMSIISIFPTN